MGKRIIIAPSLLSADFSRLEEEIRKVEQGGADWIHVDVMDGHFVKNITMGPLVVKGIRKLTKLPLDIHLMIENPDQYIPQFVEAGGDIISFHIEASQDIARDIELIRAKGAKPALAVSPPTPIEKVLPYLDHVFMVLVMSVNPGFEKQAFISDVLPKVRWLRQAVGAVHIEMDGGINLKTAVEAREAGADVLVAGSAIYYAEDAAQVIRDLRG